MWKQTNLGYLRVDRLGCRLRRLASEGEPSLLDSVLDSTPRENTSVRNVRLQFLFIIILPRDCIKETTSTRFHWYSVTRPGALSARTPGRVATGTLTTGAQLALGFRDAREVSLLVPPWHFRPARERTPERGREKGQGEERQASS